MAYQITALSSALEHDTTQGQWNKSIKIDDTHYVNFWQGTLGDGFVRAFELNATTGAVTGLGTALEFDTADNLGIDAILMDANHILATWGGSGSDGFTRIFTVNTSTWAVTGEGTALEYDITQGLHPTLVYISTTRALLCYQGGAADGFAQVLAINTSTWAVTEPAAALEFDTGDYSFGSVHKINSDSTRYILFHQGVGADGFARVLTVNNSTWAVTATSSLEFDTTNGTHNAAVPLDANHFLNVWGGGASATGKAQVFTVNLSSWAITAEGTALDYDAAVVLWNSVVLLRETASAYFVLVAYNGADGDGFLQVLEVNKSTWAVTENGSPLEFDTADGNYNSLVKVNNDRVINFWAGSAADGFVQAFDVINQTAPTIQLNTGNLKSTVVGNRASGGDITQSITITDENCIIAVTTSQDSNTAIIGASSVIRDGQSFTMIGEYGGSGGSGQPMRVQMWYLASPNTGTSNAVADFATGINETAATFYPLKNINLSDMIVDSDGGVGNGFSPSLTMTTDEHRSFLIYAITAEATLNSVGTGQTQDASYTDQSFENTKISSREAFGASNYTLDTGMASGQHYAHMAIALNTTPYDFGTDTTPTVDFTGTDPEGDSLRYEVQIDTVSSMDSQTATVDSYNESNRDGAFGIGGSQTYQSFGQSFTGNGGVLSSAKLMLSKVTSPTGNATFNIHAHTGTYGSSGTPTGAALATSDNLDVSTLTTTSTLTELAFTGANKITLTNGTKYFIVALYTGGDASNYIEVGTDSFSSTHLGNVARWNSATWSALSQDAPFYVYTKNPILDKISGGSSTEETITSTQQWTAPVGVTSVQVEAWAGGGGGRGDATSGSTSGGGGGGAYSKANSISVVPGTSYTVTVGAGGTAGSTAPGSGGDGGDSWFKSTGDVLAKGGSGATGSTGASGGASGSGVGDTKYSGGNGGTGDTFVGGGGGGGAGSTGAGGNASLGTAGTGTTVGGGNGGTGVGGDVTGSNGSTYGGGGSGAYAITVGTAGGAGGAGAVKLTYTPGDTGFANPDNGGDTDPFNNAENIQFTVQAGDALDPGTYYWRSRVIDPSGSNTWSSWSDARAFLISEASTRRIFHVT